MKNTNIDIQTIEINGTDESIFTVPAKQLIEYLDSLPHWDYSEVLPVMDSLCQRLGMDLSDYDECEDCYDAICEAYHNWELDTDRKALNFHLRGKNSVGPLVTFRVVDTLPADAQIVELDPENRVPDDSVISMFDYYHSGNDGYLAKRIEL